MSCSIGQILIICYLYKILCSLYVAVYDIHQLVKIDLTLLWFSLNMCDQSVTQIKYDMIHGKLKINAFDYLNTKWYIFHNKHF